MLVWSRSDMSWEGGITPPRVTPHRPHHCWLCYCYWDNNPQCTLQYFLNYLVTQYEGQGALVLITMNVKFDISKKKFEAVLHVNSLIIYSIMTHCLVCPWSTLFDLSLNLAEYNHSVIFNDLTWYQPLSLYTPYHFRHSPCTRLLWTALFDHIRCTDKLCIDFLTN